MYDLHLTPEQLEIRDTVRDFVAREVKPLAVELDRMEELERHFPLELFDKVSQLGLRTLSLSQEMGGAGADNLTACVVAEELAAGDVGVAATLTETATLAREWFEGMMTPGQRARFLPAFLADDRYHLAFAAHASDSRGEWRYHRPLAGDSRCTTTAAQASDGDWIVNGVNKFVANAPVAKLIAVEVASDTEPSDPARMHTLLVPRDLPGLEVREYDKRSPKPGSDGEVVLPWCHGKSGEIVFKDCRVPAGNLLGRKVAGTPAGGATATGRSPPRYEAMNLGVGRAAYEAALEYAKLRVQGGRPIVEHQAVGSLLADMAIKLEVARSMIWQAAWASDHASAYADGSLPDLPHQDIARIITSEYVHQVTLDAAQVFGGSGVMRDLPMQKYVRDGLIFLHSKTSNSAARLRLAEVLAGYRQS